MALISCPDCKNLVSDKAKVCIHCGCPITVEKGKLIIRGRRPNESSFKHIYFLYDENGNLFDEVLPGEVKSYSLDKAYTLILGHKRGHFLGCAVKDSAPILVDPTRTIRLEASMSAGLFPQYILSEVDTIDAD